MACLPCPPARLPAYQEAAQAASHSSSSPNPPATRRPRPSLPPHSAGSGSIGDRSCAQLDASTQDGLLAYGPTAARALRADYQVLGFSGATVVVPRIRCATHRAPSPPLFWQQAAWKAAPRRCPAGRMLLGSMRPEGCQKAAPPPPPGRAWRRAHWATICPSARPCPPLQVWQGLDGGCTASVSAAHAGFAAQGGCAGAVPTLQPERVCARGAPALRRLLSCAAEAACCCCCC